MKLSGHNRQRLYNASAEEIMNLRVRLKGDGISMDIDNELFLLEQRIWRNIRKVLKIKD